jgi:anion-transporting  ArsA/GET3 family ATPase
MDVPTFLRQSRVLVVAGKGGVGKTTVTATVARLAADVGLGVLVADLEGKQGVPAAFGLGVDLAYEEIEVYRAPSAAPPAATAEPTGELGPAVLPGTVRARRLTPDDALLEYLADHGMRRVSKRLVSSGVLDVVATAIPGIRDILVLGKVKQLERAQVADLILVDAPATGHAMTFLSSAQGLLDAARSGPVRTQAADVADLLADPQRCQVLLVTLPEEMPVTEVVEAAFALEDRIGVSLAPVVVNGCLEDRPELATPAAEAAAAAGVTLSAAWQEALDRAARFQRRRIDLQQGQVRRLADDLPLPQLQLPALGGNEVGPDELARLASALGEAIGRLPATAGTGVR